MDFDSAHIQLCLDLAKRGFGRVAPNPMVGCVIVHDEKVIGSGFHEKFGAFHAERNAIETVQDKALLKNATLYVNLEPCAHFGKTPPCADLIIAHQIPRVIIGSADPNPLVAGKGIARLRDAGIEVKSGILERACRNLNKRFYMFHEHHRPYIVLKWAETMDGFVDRNRDLGSMDLPLSVSCMESKKLSHQWRSEEQAIMIGTTTALLDNPQLNVRLVEGNSPLRIVIDAMLKIPTNFNILDGTHETVVLTLQQKENAEKITYITISDTRISTILNALYKLSIQSVLVEGGSALLTSFIDSNLWDEIRIFQSPQSISKGIRAPLKPQLVPVSSQKIGEDSLVIFNAPNS